MKRMIIVSLFLLFVILLVSCENNKSPSLKSQEMNNKAQIMKAYTDLPENAGWWVVPKNVNTMTIFVDAKNTETVLFWITPTGTETWGERELIGFDKDEDDGWSFTWNFGDRIFHDRISVQALGSDSTTQDKEIIQVTSE